MIIKPITFAVVISAASFFIVQPTFSSPDYSSKLQAYLIEAGYTGPWPAFTLFFPDGDGDGKTPTILHWSPIDIEEPNLQELDYSQEQLDEIITRQRQASKPLERKQYENQFFELTEQLLAALQDPRANQTPPVKLSFPEIDAILEQLFAVDLATATRASIRLLGIDAALKRYDTLWWDDAIQHELPEN